MHGPLEVDEGKQADPHRREVAAKTQIRATVVACSANSSSSNAQTFMLASALSRGITALRPCLLRLRAACYSGSLCCHDPSKLIPCLAHNSPIYAVVAADGRARSSRSRFRNIVSSFANSLPASSPLPYPIRPR